MTCHCGCGQTAKRNFLPGHDRKLGAALERRVGGILQLERLVELSASLLANRITSDDLRQQVTAIFQSGQV